MTAMTGASVLPHRARRLGPVAVAVAVAVGLVATAVAAGVSLWVGSADGSSLVVPAVLGVDVLAFSVVGSVVCLARPANRVGWILLAAGTLSSIGIAAVDLADRGLLHAVGQVPGASAWADLGAATRTVGWYLATVGVPMFFPDGRLAGPRWRWLPRVAVVGVCAGVFGSVFAAHAQLNELSRWHNPLSSPALNAIADPLSGLSIVLSTGAAAGTVAQLVVRWRRNGPLQRQQIGMFAAAAAAPVLAAPLSIAGVGGSWLFAVTLLPLPIVVGFAVLARGLYDLATAANRTLVWLTLSAVIVALYAVVLAGVGSVLDVRGASWLAWVAAAAVAISFAPLRDALQRAVNRLTFGRWDDPYIVLATLGQHVEASADVDRLLTDVAAELETTLRLRDVMILDAQGNALAGARAGLARLPLVAYGEPVGMVRYTTTNPLRPADSALLEDLAAHLGGLLHAHRLTHDLQRARERLVLAREEERRRLRRDLHDGLGPALAGHLLRLDVAARSVFPDSAVRRGLETLRAEMQTTVEDVRRVVEGLRPPALDELGLPDALQQTVGRLTLADGLTAELRIGDLPGLPAAVEVAAYRIVSEAVTNTVHHAAAAHCVVALSCSHRKLEVDISDDGCGMSGAPKLGHGLDTMRERAEELGGRLSVRSDGGTTVHAAIPLPRSEP